MEAKDITIRVQTAGGVIPFLSGIVGSTENLGERVDILELALYSGETSADCERREELGTIGSNIIDAFEYSGYGYDTLSNLIFVGEDTEDYKEYKEYFAFRTEEKKIYLFKVDTEKGL
jgi:hypothetical protein